MIKKLKMAKETKFITNEETTKSGTKKNLQLIHIRKDTEADLQPKMATAEDEVGIQSKHNLKVLNIGRKTQRISTVMFVTTNYETEEAVS